MQKSHIYYGIAILLGVTAGLLNIPFINIVSKTCSEIFIRIFKCISMPIVSLSILIALSCYGSEENTSKIWKKTLLYTTLTTILASSVAAVLYNIVSPPSVNNISSSDISNSVISSNSEGYLKYFLEIIPDSIFKAFIGHKVLSVLLISAIFGLSIRAIEDKEVKNTIVNFFKGLHNIFFSITKFLVKILPIGLFGFISVSINEINNGFDFKGMGKYFLVIILANLVQGIIVLPTLLASKGINPLNTFKGMAPALSVAFFSKSSSGALPVTIQSAENNLKINPKVSKFVLPLCTTINMNGCAAFIFSTVIYVMQNNGLTIDFITIITWILISTLAAIGNAGVPMGCFFLSASLLSSMNVPIELLGITLPFYSVLDMLETSLNVWSDSCVATIVNKQVSSNK